MKVWGELKNIQVFLLGVCIAAATIFSTVILSKGMLRVIEFNDQVVEVSGSAEKNIFSDRIVWQSGFSRRDAQLKTAYDLLKTDLKIVQEYFEQQGVTADEIVVLPVKTTQLFKKDEDGNNTNEIEGYQVDQIVEVRSGRVEIILNLSRKSTELLDQGIEFISASPEFFYTKLSDLKVEMLSAATADAKRRAQTMVESTGNKIGAVRSANMGVFQVNSANSYDANWYGNHDTSSYEKKVIAIVHVKFAIE